MNGHSPLAITLIDIYVKSQKTIDRHWPTKPEPNKSFCAFRCILNTTVVLAIDTTFSQCRRGQATTRNEQQQGIHYSTMRNKADTRLEFKMRLPGKVKLKQNQNTINLAELYKMVTEFLPCKL